MAVKKKNLISAIIAISLIGFNQSVSVAESSGNLLQMDVKKSTAADTVDVTFYTTGNPANTVVTRKTSNKYVVLLPNTSGSSSIIPSLGAVKDLVTDVQVKNVDDGIGGYTKVTFATTKPINIKTYTKKTSPLTQAQKDSKTIIAKTNTTNFAANNKPANTTTTTTPTAKKTTAPSNANTKKTAENKVTQNTTGAKKTPQNKLSFEKQVSNLIPAINKTQNKTTTQVKKNETVSQEAPATQKKAKLPIVPKDTPQDNIIKTPIPEPTPKVVENPQPEKAQEPVGNDNKQISGNEKVQSGKNFLTPIKMKISDSFGSVKSIGQGLDIKFLLLSVFGTIFGLAFILKLINNAHTALMNQQSDFMPMQQPAKNIEETPKEVAQEYFNNKFINTKNLNWQEKYKILARENGEENNSLRSMSYVTSLANEKSGLVNNSDEGFGHYSFDTSSNIPAIDKYQRHGVPETSSNKANDFLAKLEDDDTLFDEIPDPNAIVEDEFLDISEPLQEEVQPEIEEPKVVDNPIKENEEIKLKGFAKKKKLASSAKEEMEFSKHRDTIVQGVPKLTAQSTGEMAHQKEKITERILNRYKRGAEDAPFDNGVPAAYSTSSLYDYLSIIEDTTMTPNKALGQSKAEPKLSNNMDKTVINKQVAQNHAQAKKEALKAAEQPKVEQAPNKSVTNPIAKKSAPKGNLAIKSGFDIEKNKSIYLVDMSGKSAIVGRINNKVYVLKKFDKHLDGKITVLEDKPNSYIVKVADYKSIVNVKADKMKVLVEI